MNIASFNSQEPGHRRRLIGWAIVYAVLVIAAVYFTYSIGQTLVSRTIPAGNIKLAVSKQHYKLGEAVHFTITNNFSNQIYVNNTCPQEPLTVYKWDGKTWSRIHKTIAKSQCAQQSRQIVIAAHASADGSYALWKDLFSVPGLYRLVAVVNNYNGLPFADFEVMKPAPAATTKTIIQNNGGTSGSSSDLQSESDDGGPGGSVQGQVYIIHVSSSGNYDVTSLSINVGDSVKFVYSPPYNDEVRTRFSPSPPTAITVDQEFTSRTVTFGSKGTWTFRADDHSGNTGTIVVN